jgi:hypothetical protein
MIKISILLISILSVINTASAEETSINAVNGPSEQESHLSTFIRQSISLEDSEAESELSIADHLAEEACMSWRIEKRTR